LGKRIAARRRALGWSQNELARRAEVNHPTLFKIEADQRLNPSISIVVRIARALGTTAETLYGLEREEARLFVEANKSAMFVDVRPLGRKSGEAARARAQSFITAALERAGADIAWAKVNTFGSTAADVFCVTVPPESNGDHNTAARAAIEKHLLAVLGDTADAVGAEPVRD